MFNRRPQTKIKLEGARVFISGQSFKCEFDYERISTLFINHEIAEIAKELRLDAEKIALAEPELRDQLRVSLVVDDLSLCLTVALTEGEILAARAENRFRELISATVLSTDPQALTDLQEQLQTEKESTITYPVFFHSDNFAEFISDAEEEELILI